MVSAAFLEWKCQLLFKIKNEWHKEYTKCVYHFVKTLSNIKHSHSKQNIFMFPKYHEK